MSAIAITCLDDQPRFIRRRRSSTFNAITNWALAVQPGSPAPISPNRRHRIAHPQHSPSFLHFIDTPTTTPSTKTPRSASEFHTDVDLTSWGYTSVFVHLPPTPAIPARPPPTPPAIPKGLKKFKSMGMLKQKRPRVESSFKPPKKSHPPLPPALQNELLLMQFTGGGSLESNAQRLMQHRAKATTGGTAAVDTVYKDENGIMWFDEQEPVEYQALLPLPSPSSPGSWVQFAVVKSPGPGSPIFAISPSSAKSMTPTERELEGISSLVRPLSPSAYLPSVGPVREKQLRRRHRPAPLKLHSDSSVPSSTRTVAKTPAGFEDSFQPTSAEAVALAAGIHIYARSRAKKVIKGGGAAGKAPPVGSAPANVVEFPNKLPKRGLVKRLFGM
ncbi:hypothetical protein Moror_8903 [Moniliophthora roreri MCA 2997]|uniref:Uncharacterized protein n=2 Tax=Moniliophthora roreri TaxID=221103 RepID=V2XKG4_MONRO|nr:hypothetical protein Moror_8903 [Moniliophthora roreri MCA 2997]